MGRIVLPVYTPHYIPNGNEVAVIETSRGTIRVQLAGKDAPVTAPPSTWATSSSWRAKASTTT